MALGGMIGGIVGSLASKMGSKKPAGGATLKKSTPMEGSKSASKSPKRKFRLGVGRSMSMR